ncbi:MAG: thiamine diphosphokinase [Spirochaetaceae bacterium]|nr:MAG: thiamine diphosphokinase [Spirochaetaceae bacterium]
MIEGVGLLLLGGEGPPRDLLEPILPTITCTVAADSGFDLARQMGIVPDFLVGDLDSVEPSKELEDFPAERIRRYPREKDETDAELGLQVLWNLGIERIVVAGGGGGRVDHLLGVVALFEREKIPTVWYTAKEQIQVVEGTQVVTDCIGQTVSFFPLGDSVSGISSSGLKWPLEGMEWKRGDMGVSNVFSEDRSRISVTKGRLLMVRTVIEEDDARKNQT